MPCSRAGFDRASACSRSAAAPASTRCFSRPLGARVVACDPSEEMVSRTKRRLARAGAGDRAGILPCGLQDLPPFLDALDHAEGFDGIVSNFGALNCVADARRRWARSARRSLCAPAAPSLLGLMGRTCAVGDAVLHGARRAHLARAPAAGRAVAVPVAGIDVPTFYHRIARRRAPRSARIRAARRSTASACWCRRRISSRDGSRCRARVRGARRPASIALAGAWPLFNRLGDHTLLQLGRNERDRHG